MVVIITEQVPEKLKHKISVLSKGSEQTKSKNNTTTILSKWLPLRAVTTTKTHTQHFCKWNQMLLSFHSVREQKPSTLSYHVMLWPFTQSC